MFYRLFALLPLVVGSRWCSLLLFADVCSSALLLVVACCALLLVVDCCCSLLGVCGLLVLVV